MTPKRNQGRLILEQFLDDPEAWLFILDAGRYDYFTRILEEQEYYELFDVVERADNAGCTRTTEWFNAMFPDEYDLALFNQGLEIRRMVDPVYDEYLHFETIVDSSNHTQFTGELMPGEQVEEAVTNLLTGEVERQIEALGYKVKDEPGRGIVRYMDPHRPYVGFELPEYEDVDDVRDQTARAVEDGEIEWADIQQAYTETYRRGIDNAIGLGQNLVEEGFTVIITSDHGECLGSCGQIYHGPDYDTHDHLVEVPWAVMAG